jgi:hypothetical protein
MTDPFLESSFAAAQRAAQDVDQIEGEAIRSGSATLDTALVDELISEDHFEDLYDNAAIPGAPDWDVREAALETADRLILKEIRRRSDLLGQYYPFDLKKSATLVYLEERSSSSVYEFCLSFSLTRHNIKMSPANKAVQAFELVAGQAIRAFMGDGAEFFRLGWPPECAHGRTGKFSEAVKVLCERTNGEWAFLERSKHPAPPAEQGDNGIDIVVWKPFGTLDKRLGVQMVLGQCACGKEDALDDKKWGEMSPDTVEVEHQGIISHAGYLRCLAIPHHLPHPSRWNTAVAKGGVLLDRIRLTWIAENHMDAGELKPRLQPHIAVLATAPARHSAKKHASPPKKPSKKKPRP